MENTTAKVLSTAPRLLRHLLVGFIAGAISGPLGVALLIAGLFLLADLITPDIGQVPSYIDSSTVINIAGVVSFFPAAITGGLFGLLDGFLHGRLANSRNRNRAWIFTGAPLGAINGAILASLLVYEPELTSLLDVVGLGILFGLPAGAIAGPIFGFIYKRLAPSGPVTELATAY